MIEHRVMTVREPFATLLAYGVKAYETARPSTPFRGPVFIHSGLFADDRLRNVAEGQRRALLDAGLVAAADPDWFANLPRGAIIGAAILTECRQHFEIVQDGQLTDTEKAVGLWTEDHDAKFAYRLEHPVAFATPVSGWRGNVMLQSLTADVYKRAMDTLLASDLHPDWWPALGFGGAVLAADASVI